MTDGSAHASYALTFVLPDCVPGVRNALADSITTGWMFSNRVAEYELAGPEPGEPILAEKQPVGLTVQFPSALLTFRRWRGGTWTTRVEAAWARQSPHTPLMIAGSSLGSVMLLKPRDLTLLWSEQQVSDYAVPFPKVTAWPRIAPFRAAYRRAATHMQQTDLQSQCRWN